MKQKFIEVKLKEELEYAFEGDMVKAQIVQIKKPTARNMTELSVIRSVYNKNFIGQMAAIESLGDLVDEAREIVEAEQEGSQGVSGIECTDAQSLVSMKPRKKCSGAWMSALVLFELWILILIWHLDFGI